jgi:hypothetical protein
MNPWRSYRVSTTFEVSLRFAYQWCTDYTPEDGRYGSEDLTIHLDRRIIRRDARHVIFENLYDVGNGWGWERHIVTLDPPNRWHCVGEGNYNKSILDYELTGLTEQRTKFNMHWRSKPIGLSEGPGPPKKVVEAYVAQLWRRRAKAMANDFRKTGKKGSRPRRR